MVTSWIGQIGQWASGLCRSPASLTSTKQASCLTLDAAQLKKCAPMCPPERLEQTRLGLNAALEKIGATTTQIAACFIGQTSHESSGYLFAREIWGAMPTEIQLTYGRNPTAPWPPTPADRRNAKAWLLGNSEPMDGFSFRGWGPIEITGRGATLAASLFLFGDDRLILAPELLDDVGIGFAGAAWFWMVGARQRLSSKAKAYLMTKYDLATLTLNQPAADGDLEGLTLAINGDLTNHADRIRRIALALEALTNPSQPIG